MYKKLFKKILILCIGEQKVYEPTPIKKSK